MNAETPTTAAAAPAAPAPAADLWATPVPAGFRRDAKGRLVPAELVNPVDALEDQTVTKILGYAEALSQQIGRFRAHTFDDVDAFLQLLAERYGAQRGGAKGNITLTSYDGCAKVQVQVQEHLDFGPQLQAAKALIDECCADWIQEARPELKAMVEQAFQVNQEGKLDREAIFRLRRIAIDDERWKRAQDAIADSVRVVGSKTYVRFYRRARPTDKWQAVTVDLAQA